MAGDFVQVNDNDEIQIGSVPDAVHGGIADAVVIAGDLDPCCCYVDPNASYWCVRTLTAKYTCNKQTGVATWGITASEWMAVTEEPSLADQTWHPSGGSVDEEGNLRLCPRYIRVQSVPRSPGDPCPPEPPPPIGAGPSDTLLLQPCAWCIASTRVYNSGTHTVTIGENTCTNDANSFNTIGPCEFNWAACTDNGYEWPSEWQFIGKLVCLGGGTQFELWYQPSTATARIIVNAGMAGTTITALDLGVDGTLDEGGVGTAGFRAHWDVAIADLVGTVISYSYTAERAATWVGGSCGGVSYPAGTPATETWTDVGESVSFAACETSAPKKCYYTYTATYSEVYPGVWVWIPGGVVVQCLETAPGTLDTWTCTGTNVAEITREGSACTGSSDCTEITTEVPDGSFSCA